MFKIGNKDFTCTAVNQGRLDKQVELVWGTMELYTRQKWQSLEGNSHEVLQLREALKTALDNMTAHTNTYRDQLKKWLDNPDYKGDDKPNYNVARSMGHDGMQKREYKHWFEAALALDGWMQSADCRKAEKKLAKTIYCNPYLDTLLNSLIYKLHLKLTRIAQTHPDMHYPLTMELLSGQTIIRTTREQTLQAATVFGAYRISLNNANSYNANSYNTDSYTDNNAESSILPVKYQIPMEVLKAPHKYPLRDKIVLFHDMSDYLGVRQPWSPQTAGQWLVGAATAQDSHVTSAIVDGQMIREHAAAGENISDSVAAVVLGQGCNNACRAETAPSTLMARKQQLAVWSGHSMTVVRMLNTARWANGTIPEFTALALGLMAFWRLDYAPNCHYAYHTLHETMDMAKNFGVKYYINSAKSGSHSLMMDNVDSGFLSAYIDQSAAQIRSMLNDVDNRWQVLHATPELDCDSDTYNQWQQTIAQKRAKTDELVNHINKLIRQGSWHRGHVMDGSYQPSKAQVSADSDLQQSLQNLLDIGYYIEKLQYSKL